MALRARRQSLEAGDGPGVSSQMSNRKFGCCHGLIICHFAIYSFFHESVSNDTSHRQKFFDICNYSFTVPPPHTQRYGEVTWKLNS